MLLFADLMPTSMLSVAVTASTSSLELMPQAPDTTFDVDTTCMGCFDGYSLFMDGLNVEGKRTCYQSNSGEVSLSAAQKLCRAVGAASA